MKYAASCLLVLVLLTVPLLVSKKTTAEEKESLREVTLQPALLTNMGFALTLRAREGNGRIEMIVGFPEGQSIEMARRGEKAPRPLTHDIFKTFLDRNGWKVERVIVRDLVQGTFLADLILEREGQKQVYDSRPSDAIALALRSGAKIFVADKVFALQRLEDEKTPPTKRSIT